MGPTELALCFLLFLGHNSNKIQLGGEGPVTSEKPQAKRTQVIPLIWGLTFQVTTKLLRVTMRPWTHQTLSNSLKNILISNMQSVFQILEGTLPLKSIIVKQRVPHDLVGFLHWPLDSLKKQFIALTPNNPRETTLQETKCDWKVSLIC